MNNQLLQKNALKENRPLIFTAFCLWYLFWLSWQLVRLLTPSGYAAATAILPSWFVLSQLTIFYPAGILGIIGIWQMRRWGIYLFCLTTILSTAFMNYGLHYLPHLSALLYLLAFLVVALIYLKRMK